MEALYLILCEKSMEGVGDKHPAAILHAAEFPNADGFLLMCCSMVGLIRRSGHLTWAATEITHCSWYKVPSLNANFEVLA